jgi:hypothetical protein
MKRRLAASVVVTLSAVSCSSPPEPSPRFQHTHNPPAIVLPEPPAPAPAPTPVAKLPVAPRGVPGKVERRGERCFWVPAPGSQPCPPNAVCDAQPYEVKCPPEDGLADAPAGAAVIARDDGTCFYQPATPDVHCPPGASCNPPEPVPVDVRCPRK